MNSFIYKVIRIFAIFFASLPFLFETKSAHAAGFHISEFSPYQQGRANAGAVAVSKEPSGMIFNAATLSEVEGYQVEVGSHLLLLHVDATDIGTEADPTFPFPTLNDSDPADPTLIPNLFVSVPIHEKFTLGFGATAPFGIAYEWDNDWFGKFDITEIDLKVINAGPSLTYKLSDKFSIGAGLDVQYLNALLVNRPFGFAGAETSLEGDSFAVGGNIGILYKPLKSTKFGLSFRSGTTHNVKGDLKISGTTLPVTTKISLPAMINFGFSHDYSDSFTLSADILYTLWSSFDKLEVIREDNGTVFNESSETLFQNYRNVYALSVGAEYRYSDDLSFRLGVKFDESPVQEAFRTPKTPGNDRLWLSAGTSYALYDWLIFDAAYTHIFVDEAHSKRDTNTFSSPGGLIEGKFDTSVDIISLGMRLKF